MAILINDTTPRSQYTATSGQTVFTVPFEFFENSDLKVYKNSTLLTLTTNYTVTGAGVTNGGSVTLVSGATAGDIVTIVRDVPVKRVTDFPTSGPFNVDALNSDLDRLTAMVQQQEALDGRSLRLDQFDTPNTLNTLPAKADRVGRVLQFNSSTGQPEAGPTTSEIANAQTYASNALTSATAAAASASTASSAASSTAGSVAAAAASASAASTSATNAASSASAASTSASNASTSASNASTSATAAANSATSAGTQATNAASSASAAASSASSASTSASNAATAQAAAEAARDATLTAYDNFDDRYLGTKSSDPSVDNDGNALTAGALYFNSSIGGMKVYTGSAWVAAYISGSGYLAAANNLSELTATASTARTNLGLGTAATSNTGDFAAASHTQAASTISDSTAAGRALLTAADASAQRTSLGLGTVATERTVPVSKGGTGATSLTANNVLLGNNGNALQVVAPGTSGNVLTSDGTTWTSAAAAAGGFSNLQVFTSSGTFTIPSGITKVKVTVVGGGGGGGGSDGNINGSGGGGGGAAIEIISGLTPGGTVSVTVGAGGTGVSNGAGNTGGTSSFGAYCSATGGSGSGAQANLAGSGGVGSGGNLNIAGQPGQTAEDISTRPSMAGGGTILGGGGNGRTTTGANAGGAYGGGGGGAWSNSTNTAGGTGAAGVVIVEY